MGTNPATMIKSALSILLGLTAVSAFTTGDRETEVTGLGTEDGMYYYYGEGSEELEEKAGEDREASGYPGYPSYTGYGSGYSGYPSYTGYGSGYSGYPSYTGYGSGYSGYPSYTGYGSGYS